MVPEIIRFSIPAEKQEEFLHRYAEAGKLLQSAEPCLGYEMLQCQGEPQLFLMTIYWDSVSGHLDGFRKSDLFIQFLSCVRPFIEHVSEMAHYRFTDIAWHR